MGGSMTGHAPYFEEDVKRTDCLHFWYRVNHYRHPPKTEISREKAIETV